MARRRSWHLLKDHEKIEQLHDDLDATMRAVEMLRKQMAASGEAIGDLYDKLKAIENRLPKKGPKGS